MDNRLLKYFCDHCEIYICTCAKYLAASKYTFRRVSNFINVIMTVLIKVLNVSYNARNIFVKSFYKRSTTFLSRYERIVDEIR